MLYLNFCDASKIITEYSFSLTFKMLPLKQNGKKKP